MKFTTRVSVLSLLALAQLKDANAFQPCSHQLSSSTTLSCRHRRVSPQLFMSSFPEDNDDDEDDDIDVDSLGDWRAFRRNLAGDNKNEEKQSVSKENEELLQKQNKQLFREYKSGVWAHETSVPEVGGLVCRLPLEAELYRNYRHNVIGQLLRKRMDITDKPTPKKEQPQRPSVFFEDGDNDEDYVEESSSSQSVDAKTWYKAAQKVVAEQMMKIANQAEDGAVDAAKLGPESNEMLQLFLDNQETWQEVCLVLERNEEAGTATTLVINRPMARKLSDDLARLVLFGMYSSPETQKEEVRVKTMLVKFMLAFGDDIAVYVGGPDKQEQPAVVVHGIKDLEGAEEIAKGSGIYKGGLEAAIEGVLQGKYSPLDFRFFVGRHEYNESKLDVSIVLGKYQPVACARALSLKQCIALPKPLWHEVLELCGGELKEISALEMMKRDDLQFQVVDEEVDIVDELDELSNVDDDEDDEYTI